MNWAFPGLLAAGYEALIDEMPMIRPVQSLRLCCTRYRRPRRGVYHSALTARLALSPSPALLVSDPVAAVTPATLF
jgi:hypothetical protein